MNLYFLGFTDLLLSFCFDGISKKRKNALLSGALLSFCVVCEIFFVQVFRLSWEEILSLLSILSVFSPPSHLYTLPASPTTKYFHLEDAGAHLVCWHQRPSEEKVSNWGSSSVLPVVATAVREWQWVCRVFLAQMEGPPFSKVLDKKWSSLHSQTSFLVDLPFGCPLRPFKGAPSLPSICICYFPLPALLLTCPPSS